MYNNWKTSKFIFQQVWPCPCPKLIGSLLKVVFTKLQGLVKMPTLMLLDNNMMKACESLVGFNFSFGLVSVIWFTRRFHFILPSFYSFISLSCSLWLSAICFARYFQYIVLISFLVHAIFYPLISSLILLLSCYLVYSGYLLSVLLVASNISSSSYSLFILALILLFLLSSFSYLVIWFTLVVPCYLFCSLLPIADNRRGGWYWM